LFRELKLFIAFINHTKLEKRGIKIKATQYPILTTKLYIPKLRPNLVARRHLIERLNKGRNHKLTLISAPAGFGKTTLLSEWIFKSKTKAAWISLEKGDSDPVYFIKYLIAAMQDNIPKRSSRYPGFHQNICRRRPPCCGLFGRGSLESSV
jgi:ATP/maltotriose-dependent transcriptional regulator MalT